MDLKVKKFGKIIYKSDSKPTFQGIEASVKTYINIDQKTLDLIDKKIRNLHHPNLQRFLTYEVVNNEHKIAFKSFENSLVNFIKDKRINVKRRQMLGILKQITEGLNFLHENEIVHGNLCPQNIQVDFKGGSAKICNIRIWEDEQDKAIKILLSFKLIF